jgi:hypothetical protein
LFPADQGKSLAKSPADGIFGKDSRSRGNEDPLGGLILFVPEGIAVKEAIAG